MKAEQIHTEAVRIKENSFIARIAAWKLGTGSVAIVFGNTIYLHNCSKENFLNNKRWLRHELCHVKQYRENGFLPFICKYLGESWKHGYYNNKFEIEAREAEEKKD